MTMITSVGVVMTSYLYNQHQEVLQVYQEPSRLVWMTRILLSIHRISVTYSLIICGCLSTFRYWISRFTLAFISAVVILALLMNLSATWWPVMACVATERESALFLRFVIHHSIHL
jgi:hypothetical protein